MVLVSANLGGVDSGKGHKPDLASNVDLTQPSDLDDRLWTHQQLYMYFLFPPFSFQETVRLPKRETPS